MSKAKILYVSQEIYPYLDETHMSTVGRNLPQGIQEKGKEIRTFMPRFGCINERRNQLHEVIRLSGMNIIIDDSDHPLIIKVASIQAARMQVYFIDNEEFFQRKSTVVDAKTNEFFTDNDERSIFFCRGVIETVKKLGWSPDIIHCHGWFTAPMGIMVKKMYKDDPLFTDTKIVYSVYDNEFKESLNPKFSTKLANNGITAGDVKKIKDPTFVNINKFAMDTADGIIKGSEKIHSDLEKHIKTLGKPTLAYKTIEEHIDSCSFFYDEVLSNVAVAAE